MSKINRVLKQLKQLLPSVEYGIVSGNQSGDLDSVVCAISYAYFSHQVDPQRLIVPVMNFTRAELDSRKDVIQVFRSTGVDAEHLYFADDLSSLVPKELILVDHNSPQGEISRLSVPVTGIIDHHEDEGLFENAEPRLIEETGSCSSLITKYWVGKGASLDDNIVKLLLAPLVIDTRNLTSRVKSTDVEVSKLYQEHYEASLFDSWYKELQEAKEDITGLSAFEILAKDYKFFEFGVGSAEIDMKVGFSSCVKPFEWLLKEHPNFKEEMEKYLEKMSLDVLVVMTSFEKEGQFSREISTIEKDESVALLMRLARETALNEELELKSQGNGSTLEIFDQLNIKASRKQVVPAIRKALERL